MSKKNDFGFFSCSFVFFRGYIFLVIIMKYVDEFRDPVKAQF